MSLVYVVDVMANFASLFSKVMYRIDSTHINKYQYKYKSCIRLSSHLLWTTMVYLSQEKILRKQAIQNAMGDSTRM